MPDTNTASQTPPKDKKKKSLIKTFFYMLVVLAIGYFLGISYCPESETIISEEELTVKSKGIMILIEYKDTEGLVNFVNELYKRDIHSLLLASPEFITENCYTIKKLTDYNMEIIGSNIDEPFWDIPYEQQYERIKTMKEQIEGCTEKPLKFIGSRYFASDENTVKAAEALGIPYVTARGTTDLAATVYKPEEYNVRILSVSNIPRIEFKYGTLCDYSFYQRAGTPDDMYQELSEAIKEVKFTPTSHTNIGGYKKQWFEMWTEFFDNHEIDWQTLEEFMAIDKTLPMWQIPINKNAPYTPEKIRPLIPYEEEENVLNPCAVEDLPEASSTETIDSYVGEKFVMYHNGKGTMCLEALEFLDTVNYPMEQHLNTEDDFEDGLRSLKSIYGSSSGVSDSYEYYPIIFIKDRAFSGFNDDIKQEILKLIEES
ncbi:hypothetical protein JW766_06090 [Candidatus Dojkabacteria bacterium]|nr:hypothetical protein [Candidatus Dojkabacteria bacterium]